MWRIASPRERDAEIVVRLGSVLFQFDGVQTVFDRIIPLCGRDAGAGECDLHARILRIVHLGLLVATTRITPLLENRMKVAQGKRQVVSATKFALQLCKLGDRLFRSQEFGKCSDTQQSRLDMGGMLLQEFTCGLFARGELANSNLAVSKIDGKRYELFGKGGGQILADELNVPLLAQIPLLNALREGGDDGRPIAAVAPDSEVGKAFFAIAKYIAEDMMPMRISIRSQSNSLSVLR